MLVIVSDSQGTVHQDFVSPREQLTIITTGKFRNIDGSKRTTNFQHKGRNKTGLVCNENWLAYTAYSVQ
jgi:hypothetical protein